MYRVELFYFLFRCSSSFLGFVAVEHISDSIDPPKASYTKTPITAILHCIFVLHSNHLAFNTYSSMTRLDFSWAS
jgi:hypothetical protein